MSNARQYDIHKLQLNNGTSIAYIDEGAGDTTLLFVHGLANYAHVWKLNIDYFKNHYRCIAIDLPGNGHSDRSDKYSIKYFADTVYEVIQKLGLTNVIPIGHSMGGQIVMTFALKYPNSCKQIVLCAPAGFETFTPLQQSIYKKSINFLDFFSSEENSLKQVIKACFYSYQHQADDMIKDLIKIMQSQPKAQYRSMIEGCINGIISEPVFDQLQEIKQKVLIIFGSRDALIPNRLIHFTTTKKLAEEAVSKMKNAELIILNKCGHLLQLEQPEVVNQSIENFITK